MAPRFPKQPAAGGLSRLLRLVGAVIGGYLAGTIPSARLVAGALNSDIDVTADGTGNAGAANVDKLLGRRAGAAVLAADMAKAAAAGIAAGRVAGPVGANLAGSAAVVGHCWPVWTGFDKGGKGVAASGGQMLATFPAYLPIDVAIGAVAGRTNWWRTHTTEATGIICGLWVALAAVWYRFRLPNLWGGQPTIAMPAAALASSAVIMSRFLADSEPSTPGPEPRLV